MLDISGSLPIDSRGEERQSDIAFEMLRADIVACRLPPGTNVSEAELAARYGAGKAAIRSALVRLSERGWVHALARRGYTVKPVTLRDIGEIFEMRRIVEPAAARRAAGRVDANRLREIDAVCRSGYIPGDGASEATYLQAHRQFHLTVAQAGGNPRLGDTVRHAWDETERVIYHTGLLRTRPAELRHDHTALVTALIGGDGDAAAEAATDEISALHCLVVETALRTASQLMPAAMTEERGTRPTL